MSRAFAGLGKPAEPTATAAKLEPAVPIKRSIHAEFIVCLEDGAHVKMLKRYLSSRFGLTPQDYRAKWGLPSDYPMTAPRYAERRAEIAKRSGLGRKEAAQVARR